VIGLLVLGALATGLMAVLGALALAAGWAFLLPFRIVGW
jgi:hypothetical protein